MKVSFQRSAFSRAVPSSWWLKRCFTSTETVGLLGTGAQDVYLVPSPRTVTVESLCCPVLLSNRFPPTSYCTCVEGGRGVVRVCVCAVVLKREIKCVCVCVCVCVCARARARPCACVSMGVRANAYIRVIVLRRSLHKIIYVNGPSGAGCRVRGAGGKQGTFRPSAMQVWQKG